MTDHNEQFFAKFGSVSPPTLGAGRNNPVDLVKAWGSDLNRLGNPRYSNISDVSGVWNTLLTTATRNFQTDRGIGVDGLVGPNTRAAMAAAVSAASVAMGETANKRSRTEIANDVFSNLPASTIDFRSIPVPASSNQPLTGVSLPPPEEDEITARSFLEAPAFEGGPSRGKVLGIGAIVLGTLGGILGLLSGLSRD